MTLPLCLGIDPASVAGVAMVEPRVGARSRLLTLHVVAGKSADAWAERAFVVAEAVVRAAAGRPIVGWFEMTPPVTSDGWQSFGVVCIRRGQLLQALADAGARLADIAEVYPQTWTSKLGVPRGKLGDGPGRGQHRLVEAERLVEMPPGTLRGLGKGAVDAAEATMIAAARAVVVHESRMPAAPKRRRGRAA